jgi:PhzF family phenazine biosynthesis protein
MIEFAFQQIDVFSTNAFSGNPLAVVLSADALSDAQMAAFARWTNLSETTFLLQPQTPEADYRVRIFTSLRELPFAGHPTLGSCHAWLAAGGVSHGDDIVQQCGAGLVRIRRDGETLWFAAPSLSKTGPVETEVLGQIALALRIAPHTIVASQWIDNGPGWVAIMLRSHTEVLALQPDFAAMGSLALGVIAPYNVKRDATAPDFEVRAFMPEEAVREDPATGSLNAGLGQWLIAAGMAPINYVVSQGTALGRCARIEVRQIGKDIWVGGKSSTRIKGMMTL